MTQTLQLGSRHDRLVYGRLQEPLRPAASPFYPYRAWLDVYEVDPVGGRISVTFLPQYGLLPLFSGNCIKLLEMWGGAEIVDSTDGDNDGWHDFSSASYHPGTDKTSVDISPSWVGSLASGSFVVPLWQPSGDVVTLTNRFREHAAATAFCVAGRDGFEEWCWLYLGCR